VASTPQLTDSWTLGALHVPNRVLLAPLAGIGNWFVRLQAKRHGAGMAVSEMVSSHAIHYRNERTLRELLLIHPEERTAGARGPTSIQLFGQDPEIMRSAAASAVAAGADAIDINMGCPVPKVCKTGSGAALLSNPALAVAVARAAVDGAAEGRAALARATEERLAVDHAAEGVAGVDGGADERVVVDSSAEGPAARARVGARPRGGVSDWTPDTAPRFAGPVPVTVKLRSGQRPGDTSGFELAQRLVHDAGVAAIAFHPRSAAVHHKGVPDYELAARLVAVLPAPVILTGGLHDAASVRAAFAQTGAAAVMLARGALGNPWLFEQLVGDRNAGPSRAEVVAELQWTMTRAVEHLGAERAVRYLRKFYPWYVARLGLDRTQIVALQESLQNAENLAQVRRLLDDLLATAAPPALAA
jgi:tRNA-dihydrouridine synthase